MLSATVLLGAGFGVGGALAEVGVAEGGVVVFSFAGFDCAKVSLSWRDCGGGGGWWDVEGEWEDGVSCGERDSGGHDDDDLLL